MTTLQKIKEIEDEMARTQKNKATSYHLGQLRAKLAKLQRELIEPKSGAGGGPGAGFDVSRSGIASIGLIGFPSVGKSTLMTGLTGTESVAADFEFTTLQPMPGTMRINGANVQLIDLPGIIQGAADGKGRGRAVIAVARTCHMILMVLDVNKPLTDKHLLEKELESVGIRLNKIPPRIRIMKKDKGGVTVTSTVPKLTHLDNDVIRAVLSEYKMSNAEVMIRDDATVDDLVDVIEGNRIYIPCIYVLNKIDTISIEELDLLHKIPNSVPISSRLWLNIDELTETIWERLKLVRVYTKPHKAPPDYTYPVVLREGSTIKDFCNSLHSEIARQFKIAMVYGQSAKHDRGQRVGLDHVLMDEDVVTIYKK